MGLTNGGRDLIAKMIVGEGVAGDWFNEAQAHIGVGNNGDSATDNFVATQTDLEGGSKYRTSMVSTYPIRTDNAIDFKSSFGPDHANFQWNEWGVFNHNSAGTMLNRKVESLGTKSGGTWVLTVTLTVNIGS